MESLFDKATMFAPQPFAPVASGPLLPTALTLKTKVYVVPAGLSADQLLMVGLVFMLMGTADSATLEMWKSYLVSYTCFLIPGMRQRLPTDLFTFSTIPMAMITAVLERVQPYVAAAQLDEASNTLPDDGLSGIMLHGDLPAAAALQGYKWCGAEATSKHVFSHYSIIVYLAGKVVTEEKRDNFVTARSGAMISKAKLDALTLTLNGPLRLSDSSHIYLNAAWGEMSIFRATCFLEFMGYASMKVTHSQELIYTSVHLLRYSGMSHAMFAYKLIRAYPWVKDFEPLQSSYHVFMDSLRMSLKVPEQLQPYLKIIYADKSGLFPRKDMEPLVACALAEEEKVSESITNFYRSDKFAGIVDMFLEEKAQRAAGIKRQTKGIKTMAELEEDASEAAYEEPVEDWAEEMMENQGHSGGLGEEMAPPQPRITKAQVADIMSMF